MKRPVFAAICVLLASGCAITGLSSGTYTPPTTTSPQSFERTVAADYDSAWRAVIDHVSSEFFVIENFEKDSGLITVSFGAADPDRFIDCGYISSTWYDANFAQQNFDGTYVRYMQQVFAATLSGKMNISARSTGDGETLIRVKARYIFSAPPEIWSFDSGTQGVVYVTSPTPGTSAARVCVPTYVAEQTILDAIQSLTY